MVAMSCLASCLTGCLYGTPPVFDSDEAVAAARHPYDGTPMLTLMTSYDDGKGYGAHAALLISHEQRVLYDPAGRFLSEDVAEQDDVVYGISREVLAAYYAHHNDSGFEVRIQQLVVPAEVAKQALVSARGEGRARDGTCALKVGAVLDSLGPFEGMSALAPRWLSDRFAEVPGVVTAVKRPQGAFISLPLVAAEEIAE
jgi:hypothetical protein